MKSTLIGVIAVAAVLGSSGSATATPPDSTTGGCFMHVALDPLSGNYEGVYGDSSATTDSAGTPIGATVTCWVTINGIETPQTGGQWSGTGAQGGSELLVYTAAATDVVAICTYVDYADGTKAPPSCVVQ